MQYIKHLDVPIRGVQFAADRIAPILDERQITHLICARLKYDLYDFLGGVWGLLYKKKNRKQAQNTPKKVI